MLKCSMCYQSGMHPYLYPELVERKSRYTDMQDRNRTESLTWLMDMVMGLGIHSGPCSGCSPSTLVRGMAGSLSPIISV